MSDFKVIETQEQLDAVVGERLKRERETVRKEFAGYLSPEDAEKKYGEKYTGYLSPEAVEEKYKNHLSPEDADKLRKQIKGYETDSVKTRIAHETGLSYEAVQFLRGEDEETIRKSAENLKGLVGCSNVAPLASTEGAISEAQTAALRKTLNGLKGE